MNHSISHNKCEEMRPNLYLFTKDLTTCFQSAKNLQTTKASHTYTVSDSQIQQYTYRRITQLEAPRSTQVTLATKLPSPAKACTGSSVTTAGAKV